MRWDYGDKVALVTGATAGIGYAIATRLLESGAKVVVGARSGDKLRDMEAQGQGALIGVETDVTKPADLDRLVQAAVDRFGRIDACFNVPGEAKLGRIVDLSDEDWDFTYQLTLLSVFRAIRAQAKQFIVQGGGGAIVNISSLNSIMPVPGAASYSASKAGVDMLTRNAALELVPHKVRVNALVPGLVATPGTKRVLDVPSLAAAYMDRIPVRRAADPREMTGPALFLASDEASYITGTVLVADGGWSNNGYPDVSVLLDSGA